MNNKENVPFIYCDKRGGVFCDAYNIAPWPGPSARRLALFDCLKKMPDFKPLTTDCKKLIDIGFGTGVFSYEFHRMGFKCTAFDLNEDALVWQMQFSIVLIKLLISEIGLKMLIMTNMIVCLHSKFLNISRMTQKLFRSGADL